MSLKSFCALCGAPLIKGCGKCAAGSDSLLELAEWRSGKRRVFWRVYDVSTSYKLYTYKNFADLDEARHRMRLLPEGAKLYRVTVKPKVK
jgi:hypothetical protein